MSIDDLKRWDVRILANGLECDGSMCVVPDGKYVKYEDAKKDQLLHNLRAAAMEQELVSAYNDMARHCDSIHKLLFPQSPKS